MCVNSLGDGFVIFIGAWLLDRQPPIREVAAMNRRTPVKDYYEDDYREVSIYEDDERIRKRCRTRTGRRPRTLRAGTPKRMARKLEE